jgi:hypothetical protein
MKPGRSLIIAFIVAVFGLGTAGIAFAQSRDTFLGITLKPDVRAIVKEIELKTGKPINAEFTELEEFQLGVSYIDDETGIAMVLITPDLQDDRQKLEAVITHELLHMRLRVNNFPTFIFSPKVQTAKGRAVDVEQDHVNDLLSMIEHRVFKPDMERFGVYKYIDLAGDTAADVRERKGDIDGQADSINYARAILEYTDANDIATVKRLFQANGWTRALNDGAAIADVISRGDPHTPAEVQSVFLRCLTVLFPVPRPDAAFTVTADPTIKHYKRMVINLVRTGRKRKA